MKDFHLHFHIKTSDSSKLYLLLKQLTGINECVRQKSPCIEKCHLLSDSNADPDYLIVSRSAADWYCVRHNSFKKLHHWGNILSKELDTLFIQIAYRCSDRYSYFLAYSSGMRVREIEANGASEIPLLNEGVLFPFENPHADGVYGCDLTLFDQDSLADYCIECGIDISSLQLSFFSQVIRRKE